MSETKFSSRILRRFVESVAIELGADQFHVMLALSNLSPEWARPQTFLKMDSTESAKAYASLQAALRTYYGRGARGVLLRVGQRLWNLLLDDAALVDHVSPATLNQRDSHPICFVTRGLIRESLFWATRQGFDVEETSCRAMGKDTCEFRITAERVT